MPLPPQIARRYIQRFDELIAEGEEVQKTLKIEPRGHDPNCYEGNRPQKVPDKVTIDWPRFVKWKTNCVSLFSQVLPKST